MATAAAAAERMEVEMVAAAAAAEVAEAAERVVAAQRTCAEQVGLLALPVVARAANVLDVRLPRRRVLPEGATAAEEVVDLVGTEEEDAAQQQRLELRRVRLGRARARLGFGLG